MSRKVETYIHSTVLHSFFDLHPFSLLLIDFQLCMFVSRSPYVLVFYSFIYLSLLIAPGSFISLFVFKFMNAEFCPLGVRYISVSTRKNS